MEIIKHKIDFYDLNVYLSFITIFFLSFFSCCAGYLLKFFIKKLICIQENESDLYVINILFFKGIWRAPSNEIDRPGSFGAHMYRSVYLLIDVLTQQKDYNMLVNLTLQLHRTPDLGK